LGESLFILNWLDKLVELFDLKEASCRKTYQRLKEKLSHKLAETTVNKNAKEQLLKAFLAVGKENGLTHLIAILKEDIIIYSDGGGKIAAAKIPLVGKVICTKFLAGLFKKFGHQLTATYTIVNGAPALQLITAEGKLDTIIYFGLEAGQIEAIYMIRNPDKLEIGCTNEQKKFPVFLSCETIKKKQGIGPKTCLKLEIINGKTKQ